MEPIQTHLDSYFAAAQRIRMRNPTDGRGRDSTAAQADMQLVSKPHLEGANQPPPPRDLEIYVSLPDSRKRLFVDVWDDETDAGGTHLHDGRPSKIPRIDQVQLRVRVRPPPVPSASLQHVGMLLQPVTTGGVGRVQGGHAVPGYQFPAVQNNSLHDQPHDQSAIASTSMQPAFTIGFIEPGSVSSAAVHPTTSNTTTLSSSGTNDAVQAEQVSYDTMQPTNRSNAIRPAIAGASNQPMTGEQVGRTHAAPGLNPTHPSTTSNGVHATPGGTLSAATIRVEDSPPGPTATRRFPLVIIGSTFPDARKEHKAKYRLSVHAGTSILSILAVLHSNLALAIRGSREPAFPPVFWQTFVDDPLSKSVPPLNAMRLWHVEGGQVRRLGRGTVASNLLHEGSILTWSVAELSAELVVYALPATDKVERIRMEIEFSRFWERVSCTPRGIMAANDAAPRRQIYITDFTPQYVTLREDSESSQHNQLRLAGVKGFTRPVKFTLKPGWRNNYTPEDRDVGHMMREWFEHHEKRKEARTLARRERAQQAAATVEPAVPREPLQDQDSEASSDDPNDYDQIRNEIDRTYHDETPEEEEKPFKPHQYRMQMNTSLVVAVPDDIKREAYLGQREETPCIDEGDWLRGIDGSVSSSESNPLQPPAMGPEMAASVSRSTAPDQPSMEAIDGRRLRGASPQAVMNWVAAARTRGGHPDGTSDEKVPCARRTLLKLLKRLGLPKAVRSHYTEGALQKFKSFSHVALSLIPAGHFQKACRLSCRTYFKSPPAQVASEGEITGPATSQPNNTPSASAQTTNPATGHGTANEPPAQNAPASTSTSRPKAPRKRSSKAKVAIIFLVWRGIWPEELDVWKRSTPREKDMDWLGIYRENLEETVSIDSTDDGDLTATDHGYLILDNRHVPQKICQCGCYTNYQGDKEEEEEISSDDEEENDDGEDQEVDGEGDGDDDDGEDAARGEDITGGFDAGLATAANVVTEGPNSRKMTTIVEFGVMEVFH